MNVFVSGGSRRYHATRSCRALENGQAFWDWDCPDDYCSHTYHGHPRPIRELPLAEALHRREPCRACKPGLPPAPTFGHEPMDVLHRGPGDYMLREFTACFRCYPLTTEWPCTTARVLGLATVAAGQ